MWLPYVLCGPSARSFDGDSVLFSLILPVYNTDPSHLRECLDSILGQDFVDWEACIVDDASPQSHVSQILATYAGKFDKLKIHRRETNGGIAAATNDAISMAQGEFLVFVDHDDVLETPALSTIARYVAENDTVDYLYTNEYHLRANGLLTEFRKPDWSPERFRSQMYTCHISVFRTSLVRELGGLRSGFDGAQDYDLVLRVTEVARSIVHVPASLYRWRINDTSFSRSEATQDVSFAAGQRALQEHCERAGIDAVVETTGELGVYRVRRAIHGRPLVSVIIPTNGAAGYPRGVHTRLVVNCVRTMIKLSTYDNLEFIVVADTDMSDDIAKELEALVGDALTLVWYDRPFNFSDKINIGAVNSHGEYLMLLNDDTEVIAPDWCETLLSFAEDDSVGAVGSQLFFEDERIQHAGHVYIDGAPTHHGLTLPRELGGTAGEYFCQREVSGVTAAALMVKRAHFFEVGGMSTKLPNNYNDVDFCLKLGLRGYRNIYTPYAPMYHFESVTRDPKVSESELRFVHRRWWREMHDDVFSRPVPDREQHYLRHILKPSKRVAPATKT